MQGFGLEAITDVENTKLRRKNFQIHRTVKYRPRVLVQGACLKGMSRTITMQGFRLMSRKLNLTDGRTNKRTDE